MNLVCLDTHYFKWGILAKAEPSQLNLIPQAQEFFEFLDKTDATIIVPTPVITELLMAAEPSEQKTILDKIESSFRVAELDLLSAKYAADIWNAKKKNGVIDELKKSGASMRTKIKIDLQILAIAMAAKVSVLYTEDVPLAALAEGYLPASKMPLPSQKSFINDLFLPTSSGLPSEQSPSAEPPSGS